MNVHNFFFSVWLNYDQCQQFYLPGRNSVVIVDEQGKRIQIPTKNLRPFVTPQGLKGRFRLQVNQHNKLVSFERVR